MSGIQSLRTELRDALKASRNADGGWGYYAGRASRLEPTCWALAGLSAIGALDSVTRVSSRQLLASWQRTDGWLTELSVREENRPNVAFNGLAAWLAVQQDDLADRRFSSALLSALCEAKGIKLQNSPVNRQDNSLQGWAWIDGSFSWVEPTCWGLIALKAAGSNRPASAAARVEEAEKLLVDRCCPAGGWNYGNGNVLGKDLNAYVPTTALGLIAMQDRVGEPSVERSLRFLKEQRLAEPSAMALGLALLALRLWDEPAEDIERELVGQWQRTRFLDNAHLMGLALYCLG